MQTLTVVPHLNLVEHRSAGRLVRMPVALLNQLPLQRGEEALGHGIVPVISFNTGACEVDDASIYQVEQLSVYVDG